MVAKKVHKYKSTYARDFQKENLHLWIIYCIRHAL